MRRAFPSVKGRRASASRYPLSLSVFVRETLRRPKVCGAPDARRAVARRRRSASTNPADRRNAARGGRYEARRLLDLGVPGRRPDAVAVAPSRQPGEHRLVEAEIERGAQRGQRTARIGLQVTAVDHRRRATEPVGGAVEQRQLGRQADFVETERAGPLAGIGSEHSFRRANQEGVADPVDPVAAEFRQHVVGHLLLVPDWPAAGRGPEHRCRDGPPVGRLRGEHRLAHRVVEASRSEIGGVERLVADRAVGAGAERPHHRRRDVARSRPHRDAAG